MMKTILFLTCFAAGRIELKLHINKYFDDFLFVASLAQDTTEPLPKCEGFTCPNNDPEGGLYEYGDGCSGTFCDCSYGQFHFYISKICLPYLKNICLMCFSIFTSIIAGVPYRLECEDANPPLFFDPSQEVCNWCFNMCDKCGHKCPACK